MITGYAGLNDNFIIPAEVQHFHRVKLLGTIHWQVSLSLSLHLAGKSDNFFQESKRSRVRASSGIIILDVFRGLINE